MIHLILCILYICNVMSVEIIEVKTTLGRIKGKLVQDQQFNVSYWAFLGIPYAQPPVGNLRFQAPVEIEPWTDVFYATRPGSVCPQTELYHSRSEMNEDCLTFNVYTPTNVTNSSLPVILNIHGGDFNLQSGNAVPMYGPQLLVKDDNMVVTINYRLGALGFMSMYTASVPGNNGIRDAMLALKVVHENIAAFGGDPNKITLRGTGAGAVMAQMMMFTNKTAGMFQNAMVFSGTALSPKYMQFNPRANALKLARELDLDTSSDDLIMDQLKFVNAYDIVKAQNAISKRDPLRGFRPYFPFKPTVEVEHENAVLTKTPLELMTEGAVRDVPMFIAFNDQEGLEILPLVNKKPKILDKINKNFELLIPEDIQYRKGSVERKNLALQMRNFYFNGGNISRSNIQNCFNLVSDAYYSYYTVLYIKLFKDKKTSPVYQILFSGDTELNWFKAYANITFAGAAHADNIGYVFVTSATKSKYKNLTSTAKQVQNDILTNIKSFSICGAPPAVYPEAGQACSYTVMTNKGAIPMYTSPIPNRIAFWKSVYDQYHAYVAMNSQKKKSKNTKSQSNNTNTSPKTSKKTSKKSSKKLSKKASENTSENFSKKTSK